MNMNSGAGVEADPVTLASAHGTLETVGRLKTALEKKGIQLFAHIDHSAGAQQAGLFLRLTHLLVFGNPKAGTPLMQNQQTIGLDLPLRVLIWEDADRNTWLTYHRVRDLARRHGLSGADDTIASLDDALAALVHAAAEA
jgi:uncharacterized protein (DUF302 family)